MPIIVELVGVAGAGKTTLARALSLRSDRILVCDQPYFRCTANLPYFAWNSLLVAPTLISLRKRDETISITPRIAAWMVNLNGWHQGLHKTSVSRNKICLMDRGPLSIMAEILFLFPNALKEPAFVKWWDRMFSYWKDALDLIVWLDANDQLLIDRVRNRQTWHLIKDRSDDGALQFIQTYRSIYKRLLSSLISDSDHPRMISMDSGQESFDVILGIVSGTLGIVEPEAATLLS